MTALVVYVKLMIVHLICDFSLQTDFLAKNKSQHWYIMFVHCLMWAGLVSIALEYFTLYAHWKFLFLFIGHWAMDAWKSKLFYKKIGLTDNQAFMIDQTFHAIQLGVVLFF